MECEEKVAIALGLMESALPHLDHGEIADAATVLRRAIEATRRNMSVAEIEPDDAVLLAAINLL